MSTLVVIVLILLLLGLAYYVSSTEQRSNELQQTPYAPAPVQVLSAPSRITEISPMKTTPIAIHEEDRSSTLRQRNRNPMATLDRLAAECYRNTHTPPEPSTTLTAPLVYTSCDVNNSDGRINEDVGIISSSVNRTDLHGNVGNNSGISNNHGHVSSLDVSGTDNEWISAATDQNAASRMSPMASSTLRSTDNVINSSGNTVNYPPPDTIEDSTEEDPDI